MTEDAKCKILDILLEKWKKILLGRYPGCEELIELALKSLEALTERFYGYELNDTQFDTATLLEQQYHQRLGELIVADRLLRDGFELSSKDFGPDFKATKNGKTVWFEVVTPNPNDEMVQILEDVQGRLFPKHETNCRENSLALLKMTGVIETKANIIKGYIEKKIIPEDEPVVIVVNDSLFYPLDVYMVGVTEEVQKGSSGLPFVIEALLGLDRPYWQPPESPTEPYQLKWNTRTDVFKDNGSPVSTDRFQSDEYKHISGVFVMTARDDYGISLSVYGDAKNVGLLVKNLNSNNILPDGLLKTRTYDSNELRKLIDPTMRKPITSLVTRTLHGQYFFMVQHLNKLSQEHVIEES